MAPDDVQALVREIEAKDLSTAAHTWRVVLYARALAEYFGMEASVVRRVTDGAALHDVGKVDIPSAILQKPGKLTDDEFEVIKRHPSLGHERLVALGVSDPIVLNLVRFHHERIDGKGYPDGLRGDEIPPGARHFAVIDTFDAMTSKRPYRAEVGLGAADRALTELHGGIGSRYCRESVEAFDKLYRSGELEYILMYCNEEGEMPVVEDEAGVKRAAMRIRR
jgi:HD-GYP domain-containing protein (c-di-GMP phosphodiesterase class II)